MSGAGKLMRGPVPSNPWRLSASLVIAAPKGAVPAPPAKMQLPGGTDYRICMVMRTAKASFMPSALVFPGGAVDVADAGTVRRLKLGAAEGGRGAAEAVLRLAAIRESFEEAGVLFASPAPALSQAQAAEWRRRVQRDATAFAELCGDAGCTPALPQLRYWCSFVTPDFEAARVKKGGFDARFYVTTAAGAELRHHSSDRAETTQLVWLTPAEAVAACDRGDVYMAPPQFCILSELGQHPLISGLMDAAEAPGRRVRRDYPTKPEMAATAGKTSALVFQGDELHTVFPGAKGARNRLHWAGKPGVRPDYRLEYNVPDGADLGDPSRDVYRGVGLSKL